MRKKAGAVDVKVAGVAVRVALDEDGRPLYATAAEWVDGDTRLVSLAVARVFDRAKRAFESTQRNRARTKATAKSVENRAKASAEHFANYWLALAHAAHSDYGRDRLSREARRLAALGVIDPDGTQRVVEDSKKRDEINPSRAQQYLDGLSKPPKPPA